MWSFLFTPRSIGALANFLVALSVSIYLWSIRPSSHVRRQFALSHFATAFFLFFFFLRGIYRSPIIEATIPLQYISGIVSTIFSLQFAIAFPNGEPTTRSKRIFWITIGIALLAIIPTTANYLYVGLTEDLWVTEPLGLISLVGILFWFGNVWVFGKKSRIAYKALNTDRSWWHASRQTENRAIRATRNFAFLYTVIALLPLTNVLVNLGVYSLNTYYIIFNLALMTCYISLVLIYLNNTPDPTSFMPKLQIATLLLIMGTLGAVGQNSAADMGWHLDQQRNIQIDMIVGRWQDNKPTISNQEGLTGLDYIVSYPADLFTTSTTDIAPTAVIYEHNTVHPNTFTTTLDPNLDFQLESLFYHRLPNGLITDRRPYNLSHIVYFHQFDGTIYEFGFDIDYHLQQVHNSAIYFIITIVLSGLAVLVLFPWFFRSVLIQPLSNLLAGVRQVDSGNLSYAVPIKYSDEIGRITHSFNHMIASVKESNEELARTNQTLEDKVTERTAALAQATAEAHTARQDAEDANRAKSTFLANMSHEIRTPLHTIIGYSDMLKEDAEIDGNDDMASDLVRIQKSGHHLLSLINDILDISKIESGKVELFYETFKLNELINEIALMMENTVEQNDNKFYVDYATEDVDICTDYTRFRQIVLNLLSNAAKFTQNGTVVLRVTSQKVSGDLVYSVAVQDSGIGISPEQIDHIFQPFRQADSSTTRHFGGTGLGLAITQYFCQLLNGKIDIESTLGEGTTFTIQLPAEKSADPAK